MKLKVIHKQENKVFFCVVNFWDFLLQGGGKAETVSRDKKIESN